MSSSPVIRRYINAENPLGPIDTDLIEHDEVKATLFDPNYGSFRTLLSKDINIIMGRRGAGKTALLNCYSQQKMFSGNEIRINPLSNSDLPDYTHVFFTPTHVAFEEMQLVVMGPNQLLRPVESVVASWDDLLSDLLLRRIASDVISCETPEAHLIVSYLGRREAVERQDAHNAVFGITNDRSKFWPRSSKSKSMNSPPIKKDAVDLAEKILKDLDARVLLILDSIDQYQVGDEAADRTIGALMRFVRSFNMHHDRIKVKIGLPSEIFFEIQ